MPKFKPSDILNSDLYQRDHVFHLRVRCDARRLAESNLRLSEAQEYALRYLDKIFAAMKLPSGKYDISEVEKQEGRFSDTDIFEVKIKFDPSMEAIIDKGKGREYYDRIVWDAFGPAKESALKDLGEPQLHDIKGNVISGAHAARAATRKSGSSERAAKH